MGVLQVGATALFLGRAWQHWFWDTPYRALLWDEHWVGPIVKKFGGTWDAYAASAATDRIIQWSIESLGWFYLLCALAAILIRRFPRAGGGFMIAGSAGLIVLSALYYKEQFFYIGQLLEYTLQWSFPLILWYFVRNRGFDRPLFLALRVAVALTFTCHGLYAVGFYPVPGQFVSMTMNILGLGNAEAVQFLRVAGILDFIVSAVLFIPDNKVRKAALVYCVFWGAATSFARVGAFVHWADFWHDLHQWLLETLYRFPHFMGPLAGVLYLLGQSKTPAAVIRADYSNS